MALSDRQLHLDERSSLFSAACDIVGIRPKVGGIWVARAQDLEAVAAPG